MRGRRVLLVIAVLIAALMVAHVVWRRSVQDAPSQTGSAGPASLELRVQIPRRMLAGLGLASAEEETSAGLRPTDFALVDVGSLSTSALSVLVDKIREDHTYWELEPEIRATYDQILESIAQRYGRPSIAERLDPVPDQMLERANEIAAERKRGTR
jgi:hypothetical protein